MNKYLWEIIYIHSQTETPVSRYPVLHPQFGGLDRVVSEQFMQTSKVEQKLHL
jgi:hypothetical protein